MIATRQAGLQDSLRWGWVDVAVTLLLVAIIAITSILFVGHVAAGPQKIALEINEAGRQRMRAQRIVRESLLIAASPTLPERELHRRLLRDVREEWRQVQKGLQDGSAVLGLPPAGEEMIEIYRWLAPRFQRLDAMAAQILAVPLEGPEGDTDRLLPLVQTIADDADGFVEGMERVVLQYQRLAEARQRQHRLIEAGTLMTPLVLALLALFIFRHFTRRIHAAHAQLQEAHRELQSEMGRHRQTEAERKRLAIAVEQASESIVIADINGLVQYVNPSFERQTGYRREEILGRNQRYLGSGRQDEAFYRQLWSTIRNGKVWRGRIVNRRKDGALIIEEQTISPVRDADGTIINFIGIKQDVTRTEQMAERLRQAERLEAIGALAGGIAHDFNNLLTPILGYSEMVSARLDPGGRDRELIAKVIASAQRARELIWQILLFSRKTEPVRRVFALDDVVREVIDQLRATMPEKIGVRVDLPETPALVDADISQIHSLTLNLAVNAVQAMPDGGQLRLRVSRTVINQEEPGPGELANGAYVRLDVEDTGVGIGPEILPRIFEPFFSTKGPGQGTGLGLATAQGIVRQHRGDITVESRVGEGTRFQVHLPASRNGLQRSADQVTPAASNRRTVLMVDDEELIVELCRINLTERGYQVEGYSRPYTALRQFARHPDRYDLAVVDQHMPGLTGRQFIAYVRRKRPHLPCILTSGNHETLQSEEPQGAGFAFLFKPFTPRELMGAVASVFGTGTAES